VPEPTVTYTPLPDAKPETEVRTLANVYRLVLGSAKKNAPGAGHTGGGDAKGSRHEVRANEASIPR
jgi:hypothetical protein